MSKRKSRAKARDVALFRYSLVRPLLDMRLTPQQRGELVRSLAAGRHVGPAGEVSRAMLVSPLVAAECPHLWSWVGVTSWCWLGCLSGLAPPVAGRWAGVEGSLLGR